MGCTDDVKEERHVHAAHSHMAAHTCANGRTHSPTRLYAYTYVNTRTVTHAHAYVASFRDTSANIIKLNQNKCIRKLIRYNAGPLNVDVYNKMSTRG